MNKLKPCPFCGGQAKFFTKVNDAKNTSIGWFFGIFCPESEFYPFEERYIFLRKIKYGR